jgi:hypothetical protein
VSASRLSLPNSGLTPRAPKSSLAPTNRAMADNNPTPPPPAPGGLPPKPGEAAKVQPKKETVRISLPPKPSATATIKLPSIPAGGAPAAGPAAVVTATASAPLTPAPSVAPPPPRPPTSSATPAPAAPRPPTSTGAPAPRPPVPGASRPPAPAVVVKKISGLDVGLAVAAAVIALGAVGSVLYLNTLK